MIHERDRRTDGRTDRQTDRHCVTAKTALASHHAVKTVLEMTAAGLDVYAERRRH